MKLSIKYKLLILLIFLPTCMLASYFFIASELFQRDKLAYIFDSNLQLTRSTADMVAREVDHFEGITRPILTGYLSEEKRFNTQGKHLFSQTRNLKSFWVVDFDDLGEESQVLIKSSEVLIKKQFTQDQDSKIFLEIKKILEANRYAIVRHSLEGHFYFAYPVESDDELLSRYAMGVFESTSFVSSFLSSGVNETFLLTQHGQLILGPDYIGREENSDFSQFSFFKKILDHQLLEGTFEASMPRDQQLKDYLLSYSQVSAGPFLVVTRIDKESAFLALKQFRYKSIFFFVALVSLSVVISFLASGTLTARLLELTKAAKKLGEGDFEFQLGLKGVKGSDEVKTLADSFNRMATQISTLMTKLKLYNEKLEKMVEERTKDLELANRHVKMMIDSLGQGLLVFNNEGDLGPIYTKVSEKMFGSNLTNKKIWEVFDLKESDLENFHKWREGLFSQLIPFNDMAKLGPGRLEKESGEVIQVDYFPLKGGGEEKDLLGVVVVASDVTNAEASKKLAQEKEDYANMVIKIVKNKKQFVGFIKEVRLMFKEMKEVLESFKGDSEQKISEIRAMDIVDSQLEKLLLILHSLKGGAGVYSLSELRDAVHLCEDQLAVYREKSVEEFFGFLPILGDEVFSLEKKFEQQIEEFSQFLGPAVFDGRPRVEISMESLRNFAHKLNQLGRAHPLRAAFIDEFVKVDVNQVLRPLIDLAQEHAKKKGKKLEVKMTGEKEIKIDEVKYAPLLRTLVHPFLNAVDHGLEPPEEREMGGKTQSGHLVVNCARQVSRGFPFLKIVIQDDGRGINPEVIRSKLRENGVKVAAEDDHQVIQHIFDPHLSTAQEVNLSSGRGVGMGALKEAIEQMRGAVSVNSVVGKGSQVKIMVPYL